MAYTPPFPSLRYLQLKAHDLKRRYTDGEPRAIKRVTKHWQGTPPTAQAFKLADSYLVLSRALRCPDWAMLKRGLTLMQAIRDGSKSRPTTVETDQLVTLLGAHHPVGGWAFRLLRDLGPRGHAAVIRGLHHATTRVRSACSEYLDHAVTEWDDQTFTALTQAANDPSPRVRSSVLHALGCQRCKSDPLDDQAVRLFLTGAEDSSPRVRWTALAGMRAFAPIADVADACITALADPHARVRRTAAAALALCSPSPRLFTALVDLLRYESDPNTRKTAMRSLNELAKPLADEGLTGIQTRLGPPTHLSESPGKPDCWFYPAARIAGSTETTGKDVWLRVITGARPSLSFHEQKVAL